MRSLVAALALGAAPVIAPEAAPASPSLASAAALSQGPASVPGEVVVGYLPGAASFAADSVRRLGIRAVAAPPPEPNVEILHLSPGASVAAAIERITQLPGVAYAVPNLIAHAAGVWVPNDPGRARHAGGWESLQWNLLASDGINAPEAWANLIADHRAGGRGVVVAILDTGIAYRRWKQFRTSPDFTGTRFVEPYDFVAKNRYPLDRNGHGTFVAGEVAEATNNRLGLTGLAYGVSIMPVRVLDADGNGDAGTISRGIRYAVNHGANIINLSLEFPPPDTTANDIPDIISAIGYAHRRGVIVVAASGNEGLHNQIAYPARAQDVISVGATTGNRCLTYYSNASSGLDLVAPGGGEGDPTLSCGQTSYGPSIFQMTLAGPPNWHSFGIEPQIGTSMSSPEVAAAAALVIASGVIGRHPSPAAVLGRLERTAQPLGTGKPNATYGYGLLDAGAATDQSIHP